MFELIADLSVKTGKWMCAMSERLKTWVRMKEQEVDLRRPEERMDPDLAEKIYELDRCTLSAAAASRAAAPCACARTSSKRSA